MEYTICPTLPVYFREDFSPGHLLGCHRAPLRADPVTALHYHSSAEMGICCAGFGTAFVENRRYRFAPGDLQYVRPYTPHLATADSGGSEWIWISLETPALLRQEGGRSLLPMQRLSESGYSGVFHPGDYPELAALIHRFHRLADSDSPDREQLCYFTAGELILEAARIAREQNTPPPQYRGRLAPALLCIREQYADKAALKAETLAHLCHLKPSRFREVFRQETGLSLPEYILRTRLAAASDLLRRTDRDILTVALDCGFEPSYFHRVFRRTFGQSPLAYRRQYR